MKYEGSCMACGAMRLRQTAFRAFGWVSGDWHPHGNYYDRVYVCVEKCDRKAILNHTGLGGLTI